MVHTLSRFHKITAKDADSDGLKVLQGQHHVAHPADCMTLVLAAAYLKPVLVLLQDVLMRHKAMVASYLTRNYDQVS